MTLHHDGKQYSPNWRCLPSLIWGQGFSYICSASRWSWREFWSVPWCRQCGLMVGIKVMKSPCSWRCTQMGDGECWDPKAWGTGGGAQRGAQLWSRFRASVYWGKECSCIFSIALTTDSLFSSRSVTALAGMGCMSLPLLCPHLAPKARGGSGAESTALPREPGQELHMLRTPAGSGWHPAFSLETLKVFSPNLWLPPWGVYLAPGLAAKAGTPTLSHPSFPKKGGAALTSSTN